MATLAYGAKEDKMKAFDLYKKLDLLCGNNRPGCPVHLEERVEHRRILPDRVHGRIVYQERAFKFDQDLPTQAVTDTKAWLAGRVADPTYRGCYINHDTFTKKVAENPL